MSTTLPHVRDDLAAAEHDVEVAQEAVIQALASRSVRTDQLADLEAALDEATRRRDDLKSTRDFIIRRERERGEAASGEFSSILYLSRREPNFAFDDVAIMTGRAQQKNEGLGVTGCLYIMNEWFAGYLEGGKRDLEKLTRTIGADDRHALFRVVARDLYKDAGKRLFPTHPLKVVWCRDGPVVDGPPHTAVLEYLQSQLNFIRFVPTIPVAARGMTGRNGRWFLLNVAPSARYNVHLSRFADDMPSVVESMTAVRDAVKSVVERIPGAAVITPHNSRVLCAIPASTDADHALVCALSVREAVMTAEPGYFPFLSLLLSTDENDVAVNVDGATTAVGPAMRRLRILGAVAAQEDRPVVIDPCAADDLREKDAAASLGWYKFDDKSTQVFVPAGLSGDSPLATWASFIDHQLRARARQHKRRSITAGSSAAAHSMNSFGIPDSATGTGDAALTRGESMRDGSRRVSTAVDPDSIMTAERFAREPVAGALTGADVRAAFDKCGPRESDDTISFQALQQAVYDLDFMGAPPPAHELVRSMKELGIDTTAPADSPASRVNEDQFAVIWCRAVLR